MTIVTETVLSPCADDPDFYLDDYLQTPPSRSELNAMQRRALAAKRAEARRRCAACPLLVDCLYRAVVEVDVSGFVACTTEADREAIRKMLGIRVQEPSMAPFGAPRVGGGPVSHEAVMAMRQSHPKDTCAQLAERLGCSTSTVKRHLRRAREATVVELAVETGPTRPSVDEVLDAFDALEASKVA